MKKILLILVLPLVLISCPKDEIEPGNQGRILAEAEIGPAGALLETEEISIEVPPGAFDDTYMVQISEEQEFISDFGENTVTSIFRVSGIPLVTYKAISVRMANKKGLGEESYLAWGNIEEMLEPEEAQPSYALYPASDSSGYLSGVIPTLEGDGPQAVARKFSHLKSTQYFPGLIRVLSGVSYMKNQKGRYFNYTYPSNTAPEKLRSFMKVMDAAMQNYFDLGLVDQTGFEAAMTLLGKPGVVVTNREKAEQEIYGLRMPHLSPLTEIADGMETLARLSMYMNIRVNIAKNDLEQVSEEEMKTTAHLWVYRMLYYLYCGDQMDWFAYASALYMQEKYSGRSFYKVDAFPYVGISPFMGMEAGINEYPSSGSTSSVLGGQITMQEKMHAIGMYPFIKYLDQRYPNDKELWVRIIREKLNSESKTSMEGIITAIEEPEYQWWPSFFEKYLPGQLVNVPADEFMKLFAGVDYQVDFFSEKDTSRFNEDNYADLSARLYKVNFIFPSFENEASLNLKLGPNMQDFDYVTAMAFGLKENSLEYFDRSTNLTISDLKTLMENGYSSIPVVVVNSMNGPSAEETQRIELESILKTAPQVFSGVDVTVICRTNYSDVNGDIHETYFNYYIPDPPYAGETYQNKFTATWEETNGDWEYTGSIEVEFDPELYPNFITSFTVFDQKEASYSEDVSVAGENIELKEYNFPMSNLHYYKFSVYGNEVCNYLTQVKGVLTDSNGDITHDGTGDPICNSQSVFEIILYCN